MKNPAAEASIVQTQTLAVRPSVKAERAAAVEAEPAERQDQGSEHDHRNVMAGDRVGRTVLVELADPRAENDRPGQGRDAAGHVDDRRTGEIDVSVAQAEVRAQVGQPAAAPDPAGVDRVDEHREEEAVDHERGELPAFGHGAGRDRGGRVHEDHLEEEHRQDGHVVGLTGQEEAGVAEDLERLAEELELDHVVEHVGAVEVGDRSRPRPSGTRIRR